jgi:malate dehydrogenase
MAIPSTGDYDIEEGIICSFPVTCSDGKYEVVQGVELTDFSKEKIQASVDELKEEREAVKDLI